MASVVMETIPCGSVLLWLTLMKIELESLILCVSDVEFPENAPFPIRWRAPQPTHRVAGRQRDGARPSRSLDQCHQGCETARMMY